MGVGCGGLVSEGGRVGLGGGWATGRVGGLGVQGWVGGGAGRMGGLVIRTFTQSESVYV